jgi:hypothetical protein
VTGLSTLYHLLKVDDIFTEMTAWLMARTTRDLEFQNLNRLTFVKSFFMCTNSSYRFDMNAFELLGNENQ